MIDRAGWILALVITNMADCRRRLERRKAERGKGRGAAVDAGREREEEKDGLTGPDSQRT